MQRAIRRAQQRRRAAEGRRRARLAAGAVIGAAAFGAAPAHGAVFQVSDSADAGAGTLRAAINSANAAMGDDEITFAPGVSLIRLTSAELVVDPATMGDRLTIIGPGATSLTITGDADDSGTPTAPDRRILRLTSNSGAVSISGVTLTEGVAPAMGSGGAIDSGIAGLLTVTDAVVSANTAPASGGGIWHSGPATVTRTTFTGNRSTAGGGAIAGGTTGANITIANSAFSGNFANVGGGVRAGSPATITDTTIDGNEADIGGGGLAVENALALSNSTVSGNTAGSNGGGIYGNDAYSFDISDTTISGNTADSGGGIGVGGAKYGAKGSIARTTIVGNHAIDGSGGGIRIANNGRGADLTIARSTIRGNDASAAGGGISFGGVPPGIRGDIRLSNSTVSGNTAPVGGGVTAGVPSAPPEARVLGPRGLIAFDNSTVAANTATMPGGGGGFYLAQYDAPDGSGAKVSATIQLTSTLVGDNTATGAANDANRADSSTGGGLDLAFSLVEAPGDAPLLQSPAHPSIVGADPQLGALADNGGPTLTHLPALTSPVVDQGLAPPRPDVDQTGGPRLVDGGIPNPTRGDGADIGSIELQNPPAAPPPDAAPRAVITRNRLAARKRKKRVVRGTARDDVGVSRVQVAIVRKANGRCASMRANGRFRPRRSCRVDPRFVAAQGTNNWRFRAPRRLKKGNYVVFARAVDSAEQVQATFGAASIDPFRVGR